MIGKGEEWTGSETIHRSCIWFPETREDPTVITDALHFWNGADDITSHRISALSMDAGFFVYT
jgi:hypothetical protein